VNEGLIYLRNNLTNWAIFFGLFASIIFVLTILRRAFVCRLDRVVERNHSEWEGLVLSLLRRTKLFFIIGLALYLSSFWLDQSLKTEKGIRLVFTLITLLQAGLWGVSLIDFLLHKVLKKRAANGKHDASLQATLPTLQFLLSFFLFSTLVLVGLDNMGVNVTALLAGLGVGGIAVALALQNILGDLFSSLSIVVDKPFVIGDFIVVDNFAGAVEKIGLKTTRVKAVSGEQLIFSNTDLLKSRIRNLKRMDERYLVFSINVAYETAPNKLEHIPKLLEDIIKRQPQVRFDRAHLKNLSVSSLEYEIAYFVLTSDYLVYMNTQQAINLEIVHKFSTEKIAFAYPTQTVFVRSTPAATEKSL
jgi:small-conductance mechanosensitive channel